MISPKISVSTPASLIPKSRCVILPGSVPLVMSSAGLVSPAVYLGCDAAWLAAGNSGPLSIIIIILVSKVSHGDLRVLSVNSGEKLNCLVRGHGTASMATNTELCQHSMLKNPDRVTCYYTR